MPRTNRPRGGRPEPEREESLSELLGGWRRTEVRRGLVWTVQPVTAEKAEKTYTCPGCGLAVPPRTAHLVAWRADGILGSSADLEARRHWHSHCWRLS